MYKFSDHARKVGWDILPRLLNEGTVEKTIKKNKLEIKMDNLKTFAVLNQDKDIFNNGGVLPTFKELFFECNIPEYTDDEFIQSVKFCCRNKLPYDKIEIMAQQLLKHNIKDIKEVIFLRNILRETDTKEDIVRIVNSRIELRTPKDTKM